MLLRLRGAWRLKQGEWELAAASFAEAVRMARESGIANAESETGLALDQPFPWEADVRTAIEKLGAEKEGQQA